MKIHNFLKVAIVSGLFISSLSNVYADAENLGIVAKTYTINEPDMIEWIKTRVTGMMQNGEWEQIQKQAVANAKNQINNPIPVSGISDATVTKTWYYKPMIELKQNLTDGHGHIIAKAGIYNALRYKPFDTQLLFINGNNKKQVEWAIKHYQNDGIKTKIVLTQGSFMALDKKHKIWFFYDQNGKYTQKLQIQHVPAIVTQDGENLKRKKLWENWEGFRNLVFMTGFIRDANQLDKSFKLQQLKSENERFTVKFKKRDYYSSDLVDGVPIKIIARVKQDPNLDYPSLITYPLKIARLAPTEIPLDDTLNNSSMSIDDLDSFIELSTAGLTKKASFFVNQVQLAGFVYAKKVINPNAMVLSLWNGENRLIPVWVIGESYVERARNAKQFMPIRVDGKLSFKILEGKPQICVVTQKLRMAVRGNDIPKTEPAWLKQAVTKFFNNP